jgi:hypothetical protein
VSSDDQPAFSSTVLEFDCGSHALAVRLFVPSPALFRSADYGIHAMNPRSRAKTTPRSIDLRRSETKRGDQAEEVVIRHDARFRASIPSAIALAGMTTVAIATFFDAASAAFAQDVAVGQKIWVNKAGCPECHGWSGDGFPSGFHSEGNAPSLRETQLTRDQIREVVQCGRPGTPMPHFDRHAYTDKRCYDMTAEDLGDLEPIRAPTTLQRYEIDAVADYVAAKIKGAGVVTRAQCIEFFGETGSYCDKYPEQ